MCSVIHGNVHCNTSAVYFSTLQVHVQVKQYKHVHVQYYTVHAITHAV